MTGDNEVTTMTGATSEPESSLFQNRDFVQLWIGQMVSPLGNAVT